MNDLYKDMIKLLERANRQCLHALKRELENLGNNEISNMQGLIIYNIGNHELTVGELTRKGCYSGSNVSHHLKKLLDKGYITHTRSLSDRRSYRVKLTPRGHKIFLLVSDILDAQANRFREERISSCELETAYNILQKLDRFWENTQTRKQKHGSALDSK